MSVVLRWADAPALVEGLLADQTELAALHQRIVDWWTMTKNDLAEAAQTRLGRPQCSTGP